MPKYKLQDTQTGKVITIEGDSPPTEEEMAEIFGVTRGNQEAPKEGGGVVDALFGRTKNVLEENIIAPMEQTQQEGGSFKDIFLASQGMAASDTGKPTEEILSESLGAGGELATWLLPTGKGGGLKGVIGMGFLRGFGYGATDPELGFSEEDLMQRLEGGVETGATSAATSAMFYGLGKGWGYVKNKAAPVKVKFINQLLGQSKSQVDIRVDKDGNVISGLNKLSEEVVDMFDDGTYTGGDYKHLHNQANQHLQVTEKKVNDIVAQKATGQSIKMQTVIDDVYALADDIEKAGDKTKAKAVREYVDNLATQWPENLDAGSALDLRRTVEKTLSQNRFAQQADEIVGAKASAKRQVGETIRNWLRKDSVAGGEIGDLLLEESTHINMKESMYQQMQRGGREWMGQQSLQGGGILNKILNLPLNMAGSPRVTSRVAGGVPETGAENAIYRLLPFLSGRSI